jgi:hypothetical protein
MQATVQEKGTVANGAKTPLRITARAKRSLLGFHYSTDLAFSFAAGTDVYMACP